MVGGQGRSRSRQTNGQRHRPKDKSGQWLKFVIYLGVFHESEYECDNFAKAESPPGLNPQKVIVLERHQVVVIITAGLLIRYTHTKNQFASEPEGLRQF